MSSEIEFKKTGIADLRLISSKVFNDIRGSFIKVFQDSLFNDPYLEFKEIYYSVSNNNVLRGMHFQVPPDDHHKLVYVPEGEVIDVVLDLRSESITFGKSESFVLSKKNRFALLIPKGCAHGFLAKSDNTIVCYHQSSEYNPLLDSGILWNSFGYDWETDNPVISKRDRGFMSFAEYKSMDIPIF